MVIPVPADADVLKVLRPDQDVIARDQVHDTQERGGRHVAGETTDDARLEVDDHGVTETLGHKSYAAIVGRDGGALAERLPN